MRLRKTLLSFFLVTAIGNCHGQTQQLQTVPLTAEQLSLYRTFLQSYGEDSATPLNVASETDEFRASDHESCLEGFGTKHTAQTHRFHPDDLAGLNVHLVDPKLHQKRDPGDAIRRGESVDDAVAAGFRAGLFTFSEMIYSKDRRRVAFTYSFVCGGLCGHGGTVIFRKTPQGWKREKDRCGRWIS